MSPPGRPKGDFRGAQHEGLPVSGPADRPAAPDAAATTLDSLRARGAPQQDPVRWAYIEALARRAAQHQGEVRRVLDAKLAQALAACGQALAGSWPALGGVAGQPTGELSRARPLVSPLAALLAGMARPAERAAGAGGGPALDELKAVRQHRGTWSRLRLDRQLAQAWATVPAQAGPLNTERLLHQALSAMRDASPAYLQRWLGQVETLLRLEPAGVAQASVLPEQPRSTGERPAGRPRVPARRPARTKAAMKAATKAATKSATKAG